MELRSTQYFALIICGLINVGYTYFVITSFEDCDPNFDYIIKLYGSFKTVDNKQFVDVNMTTPVPIGDMLKIKLTVEALSDKNSKTIPLLSGIERDACTIMHKYLGEFVNEMERQVKLEPGVCPIPQGVYYVHEYPLNFKKIPIFQSFPFGKLRAVVKTTDKKDNRVVFCKIVNFANIPK